MSARTAPPGPRPGPTTVWVLGDQLNRDIASLVDADPATTTILLVTSRTKLASKRWHRQRLHAVLAGMRRFAAECRAEGFTVDEREADTLAAGLRAHREDFPHQPVRAMEPMSHAGLALLRDTGVDIVRSTQFLCHRDEFASWAAGRPGGLRMEDFYRWQRRRLGYLMDGDQPAGGQWNFDHDNRERPPTDGRAWPDPVIDDLDDLDDAVVAGLPPHAVGAPPTGWWATDRAGALRRLEAFIAEGLPRFGAHEDAMLAAEPKMAHSALSQALNLGFLHPAEVCDAVEDAYRAGRVPIASAEGFVRQVIGWREYIWGVYWLWMPAYRQANVLEAHRPLPPALRGEPTAMRCVSLAVEGVEQRAWVHHIQRLMVLGNLGLLAGVEPTAMVEWMWASFVDGAEWVMLPNLVGMSLHADGGRMATKPYAGGGAYIHRMSDSCRGCRYRPGERVGERACPFTTLYWDFSPATTCASPAITAWPARFRPCTASVTSAPSGRGPARCSSSSTPASCKPASAISANRRHAGGMARLPSFPDPVNETSARLVATGVVTMAATSLALDQPWLMVPLAYGFGARVANGPRWSPLGQLVTRVVTPRLPLEEKLVPGPPKRLAQGMGLAMSTTALLLHYRFGRRRAARRVLAVLVGAAGLESFAGICVACRMFPLLIRLGLVPADACRSCEDIWSRPRSAADPTATPAPAEPAGQLSPLLSR